MKAVTTFVNILKDFGYSPYFYGACCRDQLLKRLSGGKALSVCIAVNTDLKNIIKHFKIINRYTGDSVYIIFAGHEIKVISFSTLEELQKNTNFLCNSIYMTSLKDKSAHDNIVSGNSAISDTEQHIIRLIDSERFYTHPEDIMEAFALMSELGFTLHKSTSSAVRKAIRCLKNVPIEEIIKYFHRILMGENVYDTIEYMHKFKFFSIQLVYDGKKHSFFDIFQNDNIREKLRNIPAEYKSIISLYAVIFNGKTDEFDKIIKNFPMLDDKDIAYIRYIINNISIPEEQDDITQRKLLFESIKNNDYINNIYDFKKLVINLGYVYGILTGQYITKRLLFNICSRPYFMEQLPLTYEAKIYFRDHKEAMNNVIAEIVSGKNYPPTWELNKLLNRYIEEEQKPENDYNQIFDF